MSKYTTGEIAKLCGVSVRTVQYYDSRNILVPGELSEGGRRLYSEDDLKRLQTICFLREAGFSISSISALLREENAGNIVSVILEQQEKALQAELEERQKQLDTVKSIKQGVKECKNYSADSIHDIARTMKTKSKLKKLRTVMTATGFPVLALQITSIVLWIVLGVWWPFAVWCGVQLTFGSILTVYYFGHVAYICPECHEVFRPKFREAFFAYHTLRMRRLTCPKCDHKGLCVETYGTEEKTNG